MDVNAIYYQVTKIKNFTDMKIKDVKGRLKTLLEDNNKKFNNVDSYLINEKLTNGQSVCLI